MADAYKSLESILDEERREVLALFDGPASGSGRTTGRGSASSSGLVRASSPSIKRQSPARSMVDIDDDVSDWITKHASNAVNKNELIYGLRSAPLESSSDLGNPMGSVSLSAVRSHGTPPVSPRPDRSIPDVGLKAKSGSVSSIRSVLASPTETNHRPAMTNGKHSRSLSDAASRPASFGPRSNDGPKDSLSLFSAYLPGSPTGFVIPKRNAQAGKKLSLPSAMAEVVRSGGDLPGLSALLGTKSRERKNSLTKEGANGTLGAKSKSPHRSSLRAPSPHVGVGANKLMLDDSSMVDGSNGDKMLPNSNSANSTARQSSLSRKYRRRANSGSAIVLNGERSRKSSQDDVVAESSDEEESDPENPRGRRKVGRASDNEDAATSKTGRKGSRAAKSPMAASEDEDTNAIRNVRSAFDPEITVTSPAGDRIHKARDGVHPNTSYDEGGSGINTPVDSDTEADITDIKRAQKLQLTTTNIVSTAHTSRCVRTIYRGDFAKMQQEAADNQRRVRKYLVATDLSEEAAHALEWTIGTVLRDGDTLLAIYCVDEELGIATNENSADDQMNEQAAAIAYSAVSNRAGSSTPVLGPVHISSPLAQGFTTENFHNTNNASGTPSPAGWRNKPELERFRAVQQITDMVSKLLRKTKLQVKVVIEVIHCKTPKHLITEVIDYINPTLVILGSRGRSALKGVILGSFSNYLVTKSSVPVMVARKRLKKHTKYKRPPMKLTNNLTNPAIRSLVDAKID